MVKHHVYPYWKWHCCTTKTQHITTQRLKIIIHIHHKGPVCWHGCKYSLCTILHVSWTSDVRSAYVKKQFRTHPIINCSECQWFEYSYSNNLIIHIQSPFQSLMGYFFIFFHKKTSLFIHVIFHHVWLRQKNMFFCFSIYTLRKKNFFLETSLRGKIKTFVVLSTLGLLSMAIKII